MAHILVIDDDVMLSALLKDHLSRMGYDVTTAACAEEGLEMALKSPPDLIMLDVVMPDATGYQTCGWLRQAPQTRSVPIMMMTSAARFPNQQAIGRMMGANDYLLKPFNVLDVGDRIHFLLLGNEANSPALPLANSL